MQKNFGFIHNDPHTIDILEATTIPKKAIQGTPWYQVLSNYRYADAFQYISANVDEREKLIEDGYAAPRVSKYQINFNLSSFILNLFINI